MRRENAFAVLRLPKVKRIIRTVFCQRDDAGRVRAVRHAVKIHASRNRNERLARRNVNVPPRNVELAPGQVSLHHVDLVHGSAPNTSGRRRAGYAVRYMPSSAVYDRAIDPGGGSRIAPVEFAARPIWLVRGVDASGRNDFVTGHTHW